MSVSRGVLFTLSFVVALGGVSKMSLADSELDPRPPAGGAALHVVQTLNVESQTLETYRVDRLDNEVRPEALALQPKAKQKEIIDAFIASVVRPQNKLEEVKVAEGAIPRSELEGEQSTAAHGYYWHGRWGGGWYGHRHYGYWGGYRAVYRPYWGYNNYYGYYRPTYYSNYYYNRYACNYPYYTVYSCDW